MSMTRQDRQKLVLELYKQGKNIREIAKEARMSFRDIRPILNKADEAQERKELQQVIDDNVSDKNHHQQEQQQLFLATRAYKLFTEGKTPIEVAVALNAKESEITRFYKEYWKLNQIHDLNMAYEELKGDIIPFLKLYRSARAAGMSEEHVYCLADVL
jgi:predicted transcriptional regulator